MIKSITNVAVLMGFVFVGIMLYEPAAVIFTADNPLTTFHNMIIEDGWVVLFLFTFGITISLLWNVDAMFFNPRIVGWPITIMSWVAAPLLPGYTYYTYHLMIG